MEMARSDDGGVGGWFRRGVDKLDEWGKPAWIATMVAGFVVFAPLGLAVLGYMLWSGRMGCRTNKSEWRARWRQGGAAGGASGNAAFDAYRDETLRRLEDERRAFGDFLYRLRHAKDQAEFDQFMTERRAGPAPQTAG